MNSSIGSLLRTLGVASLVACGSAAKPAETPAGQDSASSTREMPSIAPRPPETSPSTGKAGTTGAHETTAPREAAHDGAAAQPSAESQHTPSNDGSAEPPPQAQGDPRELAAYEKAKPVFETHCARCHTTQGNKSSKGARSHFSMDAYPFGGHHAAEITSEIREVLGASGTKPTMPRDKPGALSNEELQLVLAWADAYDRARSKGGTSHAH
jgi:mono/diheme cytochrome c family protein